MSRRSPPLPDLESLLSEGGDEVRRELEPVDDAIRERALNSALGNADRNPLFQYLERLEQMARIGLEPVMMAARLGFTAEAFTRAMEAYPENRSAIERGRAGGVEDMATAAFHGALIGREPALMTFYLKTKGGFTTPSQRNGPDDGGIGGALAAPAPIDVKRIEASMARHSRLLDETAGPVGPADIEGKAGK
jgi:hypothetical protein